MGAVEKKLRELGVALPEAPAPVGFYVPYVRSGALLFISGQIPLRGGEMLYPGKVPAQVSVEQAQQAARTCFLNALAQAKAAVDDLDQVARVVRMSGFIASGEGFTDQAQVMNGASELAFQVFGEPGRHARLAIGVSELPLGAAVELEVILELK